MVDPRRRWLIGLPLITVAWANLHAGWVLVFLLGGAVLVGEAADRLLATDAGRRSHSTGARSAIWAWHSWSAPPHWCINPNGVDLYRYPFDTIGMQALSRYVLEWYPASLDNLFGQLLAGFVVVVVIPVLIVGRRRLRIADALILVGLTVMAFQAIRFLLILGTDRRGNRGGRPVAHHLGLIPRSAHVADPRTALEAAGRPARQPERAPDRRRGAAGRGHRPRAGCTPPPRSARSRAGSRWGPWPGWMRTTPAHGSSIGTSGAATSGSIGRTSRSSWTGARTSTVTTSSGCTCR